MYMLKARLPGALKSRMADLKKLWALYRNDPDASDADLGNLIQYGLSFDYVSQGTYREQKEGYFRYQLSWGGPADEFRIFVNPDFSAHRIEYWFMDWFDGAHVVLTGKDEELLEDIYTGFFLDSGTAQVQYSKAMQQ
jgi:hypothetical protein